MLVLLSLTQSYLRLSSLILGLLSIISMSSCCFVVGCLVEKEVQKV